MNGWEIRQALRVILSHPDTTIEAGLAWLDPADADRLTQLVSGLKARRERPGVTDINLPHTASQEDA